MWAKGIKGKITKLIVRMRASLFAHCVHARVTLCSLCACARQSWRQKYSFHFTFKMKLSLFPTGILTLSIISLGIAQQCIDETGEHVDWFVLYKLPKEKNHEGNSGLVEEGLGYAHFSSRSFKKGWTLSDLSIADPKSPPGRTLAPLYSRHKKEKEFLQIFYNDEHPGGKT